MGTNATGTTLDPNPAGEHGVVDERTDLLATLAHHRQFLRYTVRDLTDEQATRRTTVSELTLAGLIKHVTGCEEGWVRFIVEGPAAMAMPESPEAWEAWTNGFRMLEDESLQGLLQRYEAVAQRTDEVVRALPDLGVSHPLPEAPWFEAGARWSARRALLHIIAETAQHAGHADIIRESLDGAKTMG